VKLNMKWLHDLCTASAVTLSLMELANEARITKLFKLLDLISDKVAMEVHCQFLFSTFCCLSPLFRFSNARVFLCINLILAVVIFDNDYSERSCGVIINFFKFILSPTITVPRGAISGVKRC
jgi:hypothetical protein